MRHEGTGLIEAGELHAVAIIFDALEQRVCDALGRRAGGIAGETAVDVHVFRLPEARTLVHRRADGGGHDHNALARLNTVFLLHLAQEGDEPRADIELLHLVATQRADDGAGLFALAEAIGHDVHIIPEIRREGEQNILFHARSFLILAISVPGYTEE